MSSDPLPRLRELCLALPEVTERLSHGEPAWFVGGRRSFASYANHHHDDRLAVWCAADEAAQSLLIASDPERFFRPPYVGARGWVGVYLDVPVDWDELAALIEDAYLAVAPKRLAALLEPREARSTSRSAALPPPPAPPAPGTRTRRGGRSSR
ncbi:MAG TPA: MmcQ/YjbR family DNA-binding protein [Dehalococcoidia bacterium]|nr:MmcQ/YjbR family DNA-binding protein [Dehalococcoidia bacterium]